MTTWEEVVWAEPMAAGISEQRAELVALTKVLELGQGRKINTYTDSPCAFATAQVRGATDKERGLSTAEEKDYQK